MMANTKTLYHGAHTQFTLHVGQCFTDDADCAESYSQNSGIIAMVEIDMDGLCVIELSDGYDNASNLAPGDRSCDSFGGADIIMYADQDIDGRPHDTYRLVSLKAIGAVTVHTTTYSEDF